MSAATNKAKEALKDNRNYITSRKDPVMWNLTSGLLNIAEAIAGLESEVQTISARLQRLESQLQR
jgi:hypothetical protein